jgi:hypothetical protein
VPQLHGGQAVPAAQAGHAQTTAVPVLELDATPVPDTVVVVPDGTVVVVVAPVVQPQLHAGHATPAGHAGQLHVHVPGLPPPPLPLPQLPPVPPPPEPPVRPPQSH